MASSFGLGVKRQAVLQVARAERLDERGHDGLRRGEQHGVALADGLAPERYGQMRLPDPRETSDILPVNRVA